MTDLGGELEGQVVQEIKVKRKAGLAHIGDAIEINEQGVKVKDIKTEVWVSDPFSDLTNYSGTWTPERLKFCDGCTFGKEDYGLIDMGYGNHRIEFKRTGTYSSGEEYNYYKECHWDINVEMGTEFPVPNEENECGIEEGGLFIPRLQRKTAPDYVLDGTIEDWDIPLEIFVSDDYNYTFWVKNTSISDEDNLTVEYRVTLEYRSKGLDPEKVYTEESTWKPIKIGTTSQIVITYAISVSAVPADKVFVMYDIYAKLEIDKNNVTW